MQIQQISIHLIRRMAKCVWYRNMLQVQQRQILRFGLDLFLIIWYYDCMGKICKYCGYSVQKGQKCERCTYKTATQEADERFARIVAEHRILEAVCGDKKISGKYEYSKS